MQVQLPSSFGGVIAHVQGEIVRSVDLSAQALEPAGQEERPEIAAAFEAYLAGETDRVRVANAPPERTDFQQSVYDELTHVEPGRPVTYGELAERIGKPDAARAVGQALRRNPLPLVWPCHRVVASNGLGGFGGCPPDSDADPLAIKRWLIDHERSMKNTLEPTLTRQFED